MPAQEKIRKQLFSFSVKINRFAELILINQQQNLKKTIHFRLLFYTFVWHEEKTAPIKCLSGPDSIVLNIVSVDTQL